MNISGQVVDLFIFRVKSTGLVLKTGLIHPPPPPVFLLLWVLTNLSVSPAPLSYCCSLGQKNGLAHCLSMVAVWKLVPWCFCTLLDTEGHQVGIKYSMEGFIKYLIINTMGITRSQGFTDLNASGRSLIWRSVITITDDNLQDQHCSCIAGYN